MKSLLVLLAICGGICAHAQFGNYGQPQMASGQVKAALWRASVRYVPGVEERAKARGTIDLLYNPQLSVGLEANSAHELMPRAHYIIHGKAEDPLTFHFDASADRITSPKGEDLSAVVAYKLSPSLGAFAGVRFNTDSSRSYFPAGVTIRLREAALTVYTDGKESHAAASHAVSHTLELDLHFARMKHLGVGVTARF